MTLPKLATVVCLKLGAPEMLKPAWEILYEINRSKNLRNVEGVLKFIGTSREELNNRNIPISRTHKGPILNDDGIQSFHYFSGGLN